MGSQIITKTSFLSLNVRGLRDNKKRTKVLYWLENVKKSDIIFLQETHSSPEVETIWFKNWPGKCFFSHGSTNSRGVLILIKDTSVYSIHDCKTDNEGRYIILDITIDDYRVTLGNIYGPNNDDPDFFIHFIAALDEFSNPSIIIAGDFNLVLDLQKDKRGGLPRTHTSSADIIKTWTEENQIIDIWRKMHKHEFQFTWKRLLPVKIFCRLDFFLISANTSELVSRCCILPGYMTDHSAIVLDINLIKHKRGPGFWKLNCSFLQNEDYKEGIKDSIIKTVGDNPDTAPGLLWDTIKMNIRGYTIQYSARKKKSKFNIITALERRLTNLEQDSFNRNKENSDREIAEIRAELDDIISTNAVGAIIRSRVRWVEEGEKTTKFFLNLEKRNYENKCINSLQVDGQLINKQNDILRELTLFYQNLYTSKKEDDEYVDNDLLNLNLPSLSAEASMEINTPITEDELLETIKSSSKNKAPGSDGLPVEFYCTFWDNIKYHMMNYLMESFTNGILPLTCRQGIIRLLPKKDNNRLFLKNWRPLTLLNSDYKCLAKIIANRIKKVLKTIIDNDQTGFIKGRYIGQNITKLLDIMDYTDNEHIPALLISIDYEKAFDTIEWETIDTAFKLFNL